MTEPGTPTELGVARTWSRAMGRAAMSALLLAACGPSAEEKAKEASARKAVAGTYQMDLDRSTALVPAAERETFLKANKKAPPRYTVSEDGTWTMVVKLPNGDVSREGRWAHQGGKYVFTPLKVDGSDVPGDPFEVQVYSDAVLWLEQGTTTYLKKTGP